MEKKTSKKSKISHQVDDYDSDSEKDYDSEASKQSEPVFDLSVLKKKDEKKEPTKQNKPKSKGILVDKKMEKMIDEKVDQMLHPPKEEAEEVEEKEDKEESKRGSRKTSRGASGNIREKRNLFEANLCTRRRSRREVSCQLPLRRNTRSNSNFTRHPR